MNVNGSTSRKIGLAPTTVKVKSGRTPLKEIPVNGVVEGLRKREIVPAVEVMVKHFWEVIADM